MSFTISHIDFKSGLILLHLSDGSSIREDLKKFPKLYHASVEELSQYELWDNGKWIHWENLNEDLGLDGFLKTATHLPV